MAVALLALFTALSGSAVALNGRNRVLTDDIKNGHVRTPDIRNGAVTAGKLAPGAVTTTQLGPDSVTSFNVVDEGLTGGDIDDESLTGEDIQEQTLGTVSSAVIAGDATNAINAANAANANTVDGISADTFSLNEDVGDTGGTDPGFSISDLTVNLDCLGGGEVQLVASNLTDNSYLRIGGFLDSDFDNADVHTIGVSDGTYVLGYRSGGAQNVNNHQVVTAILALDEATAGFDCQLAGIAFGSG
jgi:hypothetical protein